MAFLQGMRRFLCLHIVDDASGLRQPPSLGWFSRPEPFDCHCWKHPATCSDGRGQADSLAGHCQYGGGSCGARSSDWCNRRNPYNASALCASQERIASGHRVALHQRRAGDRDCCLAALVAETDLAPAGLRHGVDPSLDESITSPLARADMVRGLPSDFSVSVPSNSRRIRARASRTRKVTSRPDAWRRPRKYPPRLPAPITSMRMGVLLRRYGPGRKRRWT